MAETSWGVPAAGWPQEPQEFLPVLDVPEPGRQNRLTVLVRLLLLIPHFVVLWVLGILAFFAMVIGWFAALFTGRLPEGIARYLTHYLGYQARVICSGLLLLDRYPPFSLRQPPDYPVQIEVRPGKLNRLAVLFRLFLLIPAAILQDLVATGWYIVAFFVWLIMLVLGRMPRPLFEATAAVARYGIRLGAYSMMLTSAYPKRLFGDELRAGGEVHSATRPLVLSGLAKGLLVLFLVLGVLGAFGSGFGTNSGNGSDSTTYGASSAR